METLFEMYEADALNAALAKADTEKEPEKSTRGAQKLDKNKKAIKVTHDDYQLWITPEAHLRCPISVLC
jgi:hypothetical protein